MCNYEFQIKVMEIREGQTFILLLEHQHQATIYVHTAHSGHNPGSDGDSFFSCSSICHILGNGELEIHAICKSFKSCIRASTWVIFSKCWRPRTCYLLISHHQKGSGSACILYENIWHVWLSKYMYLCTNLLFIIL